MKADVSMTSRKSRDPLAGSYGLKISGIPAGISPEAAAVFRSRLDRHARELFSETGLTSLEVRVQRDDVAPGDGTRAAPAARADAAAELDLEARMTYFVPVDPVHELSRVVLPAQTMEELQLAIDTVRLRDLVFRDWGLGEIEPHPRTAIGLHGKPGTGKTMIAHALAAQLGKPILPARASQLESKYHGEGGKYLEALFEAARRADAVLFIDEAESLLSRRFESVSQGSEHAVNTLRSELIQHLDAYEGVVIFATNLVQSYDPAFNSRLTHVHVPDPDLATRTAIWKAHLPQRLPLAADIDPGLLAATEGVVGRDIKRAVISAAVSVARRGGTEIAQADLHAALRRLITQRPGTDTTATAEGDVSEAEREAIAAALRTQPREVLSLAPEGGR
jgi:SpoVK/Ycf46/Vps4 family AAA+-type ATPase